MCKDTSLWPHHVSKKKKLKNAAFSFIILSENDIYKQNPGETKKTHEKWHTSFSNHQICQCIQDPSMWNNLFLIVNISNRTRSRKDTWFLYAIFEKHITYKDSEKISKSTNYCNTNIENPGFKLLVKVWQEIWKFRC